MPSPLPLTHLLLLFTLYLPISATTPSPFQKRASLDPRQRTCSTPRLDPRLSRSAPSFPPSPHLPTPNHPPGLFACIPPGGICCSDGITYVMPPDTCPADTSPVATAIASAPATTPAPVTTPPPPAPSTIVEYTWYTWTFTYYYYFYYYTYIAAYELTSSQTSLVTTVSATATDEAAASALSVSLSESLEGVVEVQTATPTVTPSYAVTSAETSAEGYPTPTVETSSEVESTSATGGTTAVYPTGNATVSVAPLPSEFPGAAGKAYGGGMWVLGVGAMMLVPGVVMVWL